MAIPVISPVSGHGGMINNRYTRIYNNPHFDYLSEMLPKDIKELFKWCELVFHGMPVVANGIRKLINYPVTDFSFVSDSEVIRDKTKKLTEALNLKSLLLEFGNDYYVYGNVFRTVYLPIKRMLVCKPCQTEIAVDNANFRVRQKRIELKCPRCGHFTPAAIKDIQTHEIEKIRLVRWDPKQLELKQNPITGGKNYYYSLPGDLVAAVQKGDPAYFSDTPKVFIEAALAGRNVKLGSNFYHARTPGLAGYASGWGLPPIMACLKGYMYIAVLRRAAEAIGMEHITPQRILFPQAAGSTDPCIMSNLGRWKDEVQTALERWRMDPNYIMMAPYPTGITNIGSQGRNLIPTEEIKDARMEMALALDIPPGLIMGDTNIQNSAVSLRILENQLTPYVEQLTDFINWLVDCINSQTQRDYCHIDLVPFKLADDLMNKQLLMQMAGQMVSKQTMQEALNLDPDRERDRMKNEQLDDHDMQKEIEKKIQESEANAAAQAEAAEQEQATGIPSQMNQQKMIAQADELAMQFVQVPYEQRKSYLAQLQNEDYVMWALVRTRMESMRQEMGQDQQQQQAQ